MIRQATINDSLEISKLITLSWKTSYRGILSDEALDSLTVEDKNNRWKQILENQTSDNNIYVYEEGNQILGVIRFGKPDDELSKYNAEIHVLYVDTNLKRKGYGSKLFNFAKEFFINNGTTNMIIWCLNGNTPSIKFYEKMGGKIVNTKKSCINGIDLEEVGLEYDLLKETK